MVLEIQKNPIGGIKSYECVFALAESVSLSDLGLFTT